MITCPLFPGVLPLVAWVVVPVVSVLVALVAAALVALVPVEVLPKGNRKVGYSLVSEAGEPKAALIAKGVLAVAAGYRLTA